jgi:hypothetical protein
MPSSDHRFGRGLVACRWADLVLAAGITNYPWLLTQLAALLC